ncbi:hypothetical protein ACN4EE_11235 [Geminocystis sp. CENA526]|uniref:hypothetical protein n=1 Tax=Geminocystis sp. CENA526 TaxID=1355871 RepID=UPI003D6E82DA
MINMVDVYGYLAIRYYKLKRHSLSVRSNLSLPDSDFFPLVWASSLISIEILI